MKEARMHICDRGGGAPGKSERGSRALAGSRSVMIGEPMTVGSRAMLPSSPSSLQSAVCLRFDAFCVGPAVRGSAERSNRDGGERQLKKIRGDHGTNSIRSVRLDNRV